MFSKEAHYVKKLQKLDESKHTYINKGKPVPVKDETRFDRNIAKRINATSEAERESRDFDRLFDEFLMKRFEVVNKVVSDYIENSNKTFKNMAEHYHDLSHDLDVLKQTDYNEGYKEGAFDDILQYGGNNQKLTWPDSLMSLRSILVSQVTEPDRLRRTDSVIFTNVNANNQNNNEIRSKSCGFKKKEAHIEEINDNKVENTYLYNKDKDSKYDDLLSINIGHNREEAYESVPLLKHQKDNESYYVDNIDNRILDDISGYITVHNIYQDGNHPHNTENSKNIENVDNKISKRDVIVDDMNYSLI